MGGSKLKRILSLPTPTIVEKDSPVAPFEPPDLGEYEQLIEE